MSKIRAFRLDGKKKKKKIGQKKMSTSVTDCDVKYHLFLPTLLSNVLMSCVIDYIQS